ncbi:hypothetical protein H4F49_19590 [Pectobacterium polaris]|nr:hypothetical protein [Pectobacterium polaris]
MPGARVRVSFFSPIAGAVLCVFRQEPLPYSHQFWKTPNLTLTVHIAEPMGQLFLNNFVRFHTDNILRGEIDFSHGHHITISIQLII